MHVMNMASRSGITGKIEIHCLEYLPTTYVVRGKVMFSPVSLILFRGGGRAFPVQVLSWALSRGG